VRSLLVASTTGDTVTAAVNADDAYWMTIADPIAQTLTLQDGTERVIPFSRFRENGPPGSA
jgi:hypothetical protein